MMKGLFVYGAMSIGLSFAAGVNAGSGPVTALALLAVALAALAEAMIELSFSLPKASWLVSAQPAVALASWALTASALVGALIATLI